MAETAKILNPTKTVLLPAREAGCSLAASITAADVRELKLLVRLGFQRLVQRVNRRWILDLIKCPSGDVPYFRIRIAKHCDERLGCFVWRAVPQRPDSANADLLAPVCQRCYQHVIEAIAVST